MTRAEVIEAITCAYGSVVNDRCCSREEVLATEAELADVLTWVKDEDELTQAKLEAYLGGIKSASLAMRAVLALKCDVGIITEDTARSIFESVGLKLDEVFAELAAEDEKRRDHDSVS